MVLTAAQTTAFFTDAAQMALAAATHAQIQVEGITQVSDLAELDDDGFDTLTANLRKPVGRVPDPNPHAAAGATIPTPPFVFGVKSQLRLNSGIRFPEYSYQDTVDTTLKNIRSGAYSRVTKSQTQFASLPKIERRIRASAPNDSDRNSSSSKFK